MRLIGDYLYGSSDLNGKRYAIVKNYGIVERILLVKNDGSRNEVIWREGDCLTDEIITIMARADYTPPPVDPFMILPFI